MAIEVRSSAFEDGDAIPARYTCDGPDVSPPLSWGSVPDGTQSLALVTDDPDAPRAALTATSSRSTPLIRNLPLEAEQQNKR
jgi:phosphatidylethanolamine-binding protein (PEBP) family uncharacterized protein